MSGLLTRRLLNIQEYHSMAEAGILTPKDRVELIRGEIINMSPIGSQHAACVNRLTRIFIKSIGEQAIISIQNPIHIPPSSEPEPDILVLNPQKGEYADRHPEAKDTILLIEVADSSYAYDREIKIPLYAEAGVPVVWLIDLQQARIDLFQKPQHTSYLEIQTYNESQSISIPTLDFTLSVKEILGL